MQSGSYIVDKSEAIREPMVSGMLSVPDNVPKYAPNRSISKSESFMSHTLTNVFRCQKQLI